MNKLRYAFIILFVLAADCPVRSQNRMPPRRPGYLSGSEIPDLAKIVPQAPADGDARDVADRVIFRETRSLEGSARWALAASDDDVSMAGLMKAFSCALGVTPNEKNAPRLIALLTRAMMDSISAVNPLKNRYQRKRPFLVDEGRICLASSARLAKNWDYPSGHTTAGWTVGLLLAELASDRSTEILLRARAFGESRVVCGVHNASAVEAARIGATAMVAALHSSAAFRKDMEAARMELAALRKTPAAQSEVCTIEAATIAEKPY